MNIIQNPIPSDGYLSNSSSLAPQSGWKWVQPRIEHGQRLSGTVTIARLPIRVDGIPEANPALFDSLSMRLLVDGVPQPSFVIDTTQWPDGTHVLGIQAMTAADQVENGSRIAVFNNSGAPVTSKAGQSVVGHFYGSHRYNSLASMRVDVTEPQPYPLGHPAATHPPPTPEDAQILATGKVWWVEGFQHQGTGLYTNFPMLVKNAQGDHFTKHWNPQKGLSSVLSVAAVRCAPAYDGPRGVAMLSPYATLVAGTRPLASGHKGWLGVDIAGRLVDADISGEVRTIFGPRSVAGAVQTDPDLTAFTLDQRVAAGEKEYVGTGPYLVMPQDCWPLGDDLTMVADTGANGVYRVSRSQARVVSSTPAAAVTSVWFGFGAEWWVTKDSLWRAGTKVSTITDAYWVRGDEERGSVYVLTDTMKVYEVDPTTGAATLRITDPARTTHQLFAFMDVDRNGTIGPKGRIYFSMSGSYSSNTAIHYADPGEWIERNWLPGVLNAGNQYTSQQARIDTFGHYLWGVSAHPDEAMWVSAGISNSSWKVATAHLGEPPVVDPPIVSTVYSLGDALWRVGKRDVALGLGHVFGGFGAGGLGYSVDALRNGTVADFKALLAPALTASYTDAERAAVASYAWAQRSRSHFPAAVVEPPPPPPPDPEPAPTPAPHVHLTRNEIDAIIAMLTAWGVPADRVAAAKAGLDSVGPH